MVVNVLYMLGSLNRGGTENLVLDIFNNYQNTRFNILAVYRKAGLLEKEYKTTKVPVFRLFPYSKLDIIYFWRLRRFIKKNNISIIHSHLTIDSIFAYLSTIGLPVKLILTYHSNPTNEGFVMKIMRSFIMGKTDVNIFVSKTQQQKFEEKYNVIPRKRVLYNGIDFKKFNNSIVKEDLRITYDLKGNELLLGSVGNFTSVRDHFTICKFLLNLHKSGVNFKFVFVGAKSNAEPHLYDICYEFCKYNNLLDNVFFLGGRDDVPNILQQLDAFIYSSARDTFGIALIEAIYSGIPVFVNDWDVMVEITNNGEWVTLYTTGNEDDLFAKFMLFCEDSRPYKLKAETSSICVEQAYSIKKHIQDLEVIYKSLIKEFTC